MSTLTSVSRSGELFVYIDKPLDTDVISSDGENVKLNFTLNDLNKIAGKEIKLALKDAADNIQYYPCTLTSIGFIFGIGVLVFAAIPKDNDPDTHDWVIVIED